MLKQELKIFFSALMFYTRIPSPKWIGFDLELQKKSVRYFPLMGWIIGGLAAGTFFLADLVFDGYITVFIPVLVSVMATGAFHEDGLADTCDGFGGGWKKKDILTIMKDSRVGTYGAIAIVLAIIFRSMGFLGNMETEMNLYFPYRFVLVTLISAHSLSRLMALTVMINRPYARLEGSKSKDIVTQLNWTSKNYIIALILGVLPLCFFYVPTAFLILIPMYLTAYLMGEYFVRKIEGYTGDCLGAVQQVTEVIFYLGMIVIWKYI